MSYRTSQHVPCPARAHGSETYATRQAGRDILDHAVYSFDKLTLGPGRDAMHVLLVLQDDDLIVYEICGKELKLLGGLYALGGRLLGAKLLPVKCQDGIGPLVVVVLHSTNLVDSQIASTGDSGLARPDYRRLLSCSKTVVAVYSIRDGQKIASLFSTPARESEQHPYGKMEVKVSGPWIIVSSAISGEVYVFQTYYENDKKDDAKPKFRCLCKTWTSIASATTRKRLASSSESDDSRHSLEVALHRQVILALSDRWLCVIPPKSSSQASLNGDVLVKQDNRPIGLSNQTPTTEPKINCDTIQADQGGLVNKIARDATQELVKGARWIGTQGLSAWNNYWSNTSTMPQPSQHPATHNSFPPTHAPEDQPDRQRDQAAALVSLIDLHEMSCNRAERDGTGVHAFATFSLPNGCSHLSFDPTGLKLLTASNRGDLQSVWELKEIRGRLGHTISPTLPTEAVQPGLLREIARYTRITEAQVIDVCWQAPNGAKVAMVTARGTVHIYDLPASAFRWPPSRPSLSSTSTLEPDGQVASHARGPGNGLGGAFGVLAGKAQPLMAAVKLRTGDATMGTTSLGSLTTSAASMGAKTGLAVVAGINKSLTNTATETVNMVRHLGENRVSLPGMTHGSAISPGRVTWFETVDAEAVLAVTGVSLLRIYTIRQSQNPQAGRRRPSTTGSKPVEIRVPTIEAGDHTRRKRMESMAVESEQSAVVAEWCMSDRIVERENLVGEPLSYAEIESHAAHEPFHHDRRTCYYTYARGGETLGDPCTDGAETRETSSDDAQTMGPDLVKGKIDGSAWAFGEHIEATQLGRFDHVDVRQVNKSTLIPRCAANEVLPSPALSPEISLSSLNSLDDSVEGPVADGDDLVDEGDTVAEEESLQLIDPTE